jgi:hypothetical protein
MTRTSENEKIKFRPRSQMSLRKKCIHVFRLFWASIKSHHHVVMRPIVLLQNMAVPLTIE